MANQRFKQTNFTAGVLDPKLAAREDITFYYNGLKNAVNQIVIPQGGVTARPGKQFIRALSPVLEVFDLAGATASGPNGGAAADLIDGDEATFLRTSNNLGATDPFVVAHFDLGSAPLIDAVDVVNCQLSSLSLSGEMFIQYSPDDSVWQNFGDAFDLDANKRSRRLRRSSGGVTARYWRLVRVGSTNIVATVELTEVRFWQRGSAVSEGRLFPFTNSTKEAYMMAVSDLNIDVLRGADFKGSISIPHDTAKIPFLNYTQSLDTMLLFHKNVQPWRIFRQGADDEFDWRKQDFDNIPVYDYGAGTGGVNEVQYLNDGGTVASGDRFTITLEGETTSAIAAGGRSTTASAIQAALRALGNTSLNGVTVTDSSEYFAVTFGGDDGAQPWGKMDVRVLKGVSLWSVNRSTKGQRPGEAIMSDARGWPRAGAFHQFRLHLGGIEGVPDAWLASVNKEYFNFDILKDDATKALLFRAESDEVRAIYDIIVGKHLTFFANDGEFYVPNTKIDKEAYPDQTTDVGFKEGLKAYRVQGGLIFLQGIKDAKDPAREVATAIYELVYNDSVVGYSANLLSKLSGHLIKNPVALALRKAINTDENDLMVLVNEDGTGGAFTVLREDDVNAAVPLAVRDGDKIKAVAVDKLRRVYFIVERIINGAPVRYIEMWNDDLYLDCGAVVTMVHESVAASGDAQSIFTYSFTSPADVDDISVRLNGGRLTAVDFSVDLGAKTVTLSAAIAAGIVAGDIIRIAIAQDEITGADHLEGETVATFVDGSPGDYYTVTGGGFTLNAPADQEIQYGFEYDLSGELMPLRVPEAQTLEAEEIRVVNVIMNLFETVGIELKVNGGKWENVPLSVLDSDVLDRSALELLFTGEILSGEYLGQEVGAPVAYRRPQSGPFTLLSMTREVDL